jgi:hypothetical protein
LSTRKDVWARFADGTVGLYDGARTWLASGPLPHVPPLDDELLVPVPLRALATEQERPVPRLAPLEAMVDRIGADVARGELSPFVLSRARRRADALAFVNAGQPESDIDRIARDVERALREGAR